MSKLKAVLITALLGSSTAAMASPSVSFSADASISWSTSAGGAIIRDHRTEPAPMPMPSTTWISLGAPLHLANGRDVLRPQAGMFSQVRLQATTGLSYIQKVTVRFKDGGMQTVTFNQWLTSRNSMLQFDLNQNHRAIDTITVQGTGGYRNQGGSYQVFVQGSRQISLPHQPTLPQYPTYETPVSYPAQGAVLASNINFAMTDGRRFITVGADKGAFSTIHIQENSGSNYIEAVKVDFADGSSQLMNAVDKTLTAGQGLDLSLDGAGRRQILQVTLWQSESAVQFATGELTVTAR